MTDPVDFRTDPSRYRHWRVEHDGPVATVWMDVDERGALFDGYELKLNSYDLGVDIELADVVQRMRFEHPEVGAVVLRSAKEQVFSAGANIRMLGGAEHAHKVNFCKFTNETRNAYEAAGDESGQRWMAAVRGACAGGGYELALACEHILLVDDTSSSVALPEVPLLAVLPGTGGLTRVTDKRKVRPDLADVFCSIEEGVRGQRALDWRLVDETCSKPAFEDAIAARAAELARGADATRTGIELTPIERTVDADGSLAYALVDVAIDRGRGIASVALKGPEEGAPSSVRALHGRGADAWSLRLARELDDALLHLRFNELEVGTLTFTTVGDPRLVLEHEAFLLAHREGDWLSREVLLLWKRVLKRLDLTSRSLVALIENGGCWAGMLAEIPFACDRSYMMEGEFEDDDRSPATLTLGEGAFGAYPMSNGLTRLRTRFLGEPERVDAARERVGEPLDGRACTEHGLVTFAHDDIDWEDELRVFLEERASFSPDALTAMEANLRFAGPETMETRIFGRLAAWQNWVFGRPNAVGERGALQRYGTGKRGEFDRRRV